MIVFAIVNALTLGASFIRKTSLGFLSLIFTIGSIAVYSYIRDDLDSSKVDVSFIFLIISFFSGIFSFIHHLIFKAFSSAVKGMEGVIIQGFVSSSFIVSGMLIFLLIVLIVLYSADEKRREKIKGLKDMSIGNLKKEKTEKTELSGEPDIILGVDADTGKDVVLQHMSRYVHTLCLGPTGSGKTSQSLLPMVWQDMQRDNIGITVIEPKGDMAEVVWAMAKMKGKKVLFFDPTHPNCPYFNPLHGKEGEVIENMCTTFSMLDPDSSQFFKNQNETLLRNALKVLKRLEVGRPGVYAINFITLSRLIQNINDEGKKMVLDFSRLGGNDVIKKENDDIAAWFMNDYFTGASPTGRGGTKTYEHCSGVRAQLSKLISNEYLRKVLNPPIGRNDIDFEKHLAEGGVVAMSSAQGDLRELSKTLGLFLILQFQAAVFRRPGPEDARMPHMLTIDEFQEFANKSMGILLTQGRSYRVGCSLATQARKQIAMGPDGNSFLSLVSANARNLIIYPGIEAEDAKYYSDQFGEVKKLDKREIETTKPFDPFRGNFGFDKDVVRRAEVMTKTRFSASDIRFRPFKTITYGLVKDNSMSEPGVANINFIPYEVKLETDRIVEEYREEKKRLIEEMELDSGTAQCDTKKNIEDNSKTMYDDKDKEMSKNVENELDISGLDELFEEDGIELPEDIPDSIVFDDDDDELTSSDDDFLNELI